jgi:hypothetical protein
MIFEVCPLGKATLGVEGLGILVTPLCVSNYLCPLTPPCQGRSMQDAPGCRGCAAGEHDDGPSTAQESPSAGEACRARAGQAGRGRLGASWQQMILVTMCRRCTVYGVRASSRESSGAGSLANSWDGRRHVMGATLNRLRMRLRGDAIYIYIYIYIYVCVCVCVCEGSQQRMAAQLYNQIWGITGTRTDHPSWSHDLPSAKLILPHSFLIGTRPSGGSEYITKRNEMCWSRDENAWASKPKQPAKTDVTIIGAKRR